MTIPTIYIKYRTEKNDDTEEFLCLKTEDFSTRALSKPSPPPSPHEIVAEPPLIMVRGEL